MINQLMLHQNGTYGLRNEPRRRDPMTPPLAILSIYVILFSGPFVSVGIGTLKSPCSMASSVVRADWKEVYGKQRSGTSRPPDGPVSLR
jgi:hypothetical protein